MRKNLLFTAIAATMILGAVFAPDIRNYVLSYLDPEASLSSAERFACMRRASKNAEKFPGSDTAWHASYTSCVEKLARN